MLDIALFQCPQNVGHCIIAMPTKCWTLLCFSTHKMMTLHCFSAHKMLTLHCFSAHKMLDTALFQYIALLQYPQNVGHCIVSVHTNCLTFHCFNTHKMFCIALFQYPQDVRLQSFKFTNCLPASKEIMVVNSLSFLPDPLVFPGPLNVSFSINMKSTVDAPLKVTVYGRRFVQV